jgi:hypothetical protein
MVNGLFVYGMLNFIIFLAFIPKQGGPAMMSPSTVRGFSGHWMIFYSVAMAVLYSGAHVKDRDLRHQCPQGHAVSPLAKFCEECGQAVSSRLSNHGV